MEIIGMILYEFKLTVGQAYEFYQLIGEEDRNSILIQTKKEPKIEN